MHQLSVKQKTAERQLVVWSVVVKNICQRYILDPGPLPTAKEMTNAQKFVVTLNAHVPKSAQ